MLQKASLISLLVGGLCIKTKTILLQKYSSANSNQIGIRWALCCAELYVVENAPLRHKKSPFATSSHPLALFWAMPNLNLIPLSFNAHRLSYNTLLCLLYSRLYILPFHIVKSSISDGLYLSLYLCLYL